MFISTRDQGGRRRSRPFGSNRTARVSRLSLMSGITATSGGSGGSTSTVTQETFSRSRRDHPKRRVRRRRLREHEGTEMEEIGNLADGSTERKDVDVFEFLVEEKGDKVKRIQASEDTSLAVRSGSVGTNEDTSDPECYYRSHLSDSGISMGSNSTGEPAHLEAFVRAPLPPLLEEMGDQQYALGQPTFEPPYYRNESPMAWAHIPGGAYGFEQIPSSPVSSRGFVLPYEYPPSENRSTAPVAESASPKFSTAPLIFKDKHGPQGLKPFVFRKFAKLNVKMLLQMQVNIADLEHELALLDTKAVSVETPAKRRKSESSKAPRKSSKDLTRRTELHQEIQKALNQYHQALISHHQICRITSPSSSEEVTDFKQWLQAYLVPSNKTQLLPGDGTDLVRLVSASNDLTSTTFRLIAFSVIVNLLIPLLTFKVIFSVLNRMIFIAMITVAGALALDKAAVKVRVAHRNCIIAFTCVSLGAALFL